MKPPEETVCPLCERPRPPGAARCACNYVFEYDPAERPRFAPAAAASPAPRLLLLMVAAVASTVGFVLTKHQPGFVQHAEIGWFLVPAGLFSLAGAIFDWDWFMAARKARRLVWILGRTGTRLVYATIGGGLAGVGVAMLLA